MAALEQIREGAAPAEVAGLYRDIRQQLRLTFVPLLFRALAPHRGVLRACWQQLRPNVTTRAFEFLSDELRARLATAAVELGTPLIEPVLASAGLDVDELDDLREQVDLFHYADAKVLLSAGALEALVLGTAVGGHRLRAEALRRLPEGAPADAPELMLMPEEPGGVEGELFHEINATLGLPVAEIDLRALGHWPELVEVGWREVGGPLFSHRALGAAAEHLHDEVRKAAQRLPFAISPDASPFSDHPDLIAPAARVVAALQRPLLNNALFTAALKVSLDGAQEALDSPYPVEWPEVTIDQVDVT
jgi:hypothetical protein